MNKIIYLSHIKILFLSLALIYAALAFSEETSIKKVNSNIQDFFPKTCVFTGDFEQKKETEHLPLLSSGKLFFNCKQGLIWRNVKPFKEDTVYTNSGFNFRFISDEPLEQLNGQQHIYLSNLLLDILSADIDAIEKDFHLSTSSKNQIDHKKIDAETPKEIKNDTIILIPKNKNIAEYLASIDIEKAVYNKQNSITILVKTKSLKTTQIDIRNIQYLTTTDHGFKMSRNLCFKHLKTLSTIDSPCEILENPKKYISFGSSN
jgi:hypothetical protein